MDREILMAQLTQAEQRFGIGECEATRLRHELMRLERAGAATADTKQALQLCEQSQVTRWAERARLSAELSASKNFPPASTKPLHGELAPSL